MPRTDSTIGTIRSTDPASLASWIEEGSVMLVDVREHVEHAAGRIAGSTNVPLSSLDPTDAPTNPEKRLVVYCRTGARSKRAARLIVQRRSIEVLNLQGGFLAWRSEGRAVETPTPDGDGSATPRGPKALLRRLLRIFTSDEQGK